MQRFAMPRTGSTPLASSIFYRVKLAVIGANSYRFGTSSELIANSVSLSSSSHFIFNDLAATPAKLEIGLTYVAIDTSGGISGQFENLLDGSIYTYDLNTFLADYTSDELVLQVVSVPEPAAWAMVLPGLGILLAARKWRMRAAAA